MSNEAKEQINEILESLPELPLSGDGAQRGKVNWDEVREHFLSVQGEKTKWCTVDDINTYIKDDLGVPEISYSSTHSWLRRVDKKGEYHVVKKVYDKKAYYAITKVAKIE